MTPVEITSLVKDQARKLGFDRVGIARPGPSPRATYYRRWLTEGYGGEMAYLSQNAELREDPGLLLGGARSAVCVALNYRSPEPEESDAGATGRVARYVRGHDYHRVIRGMLDELVVQLRRRLDEPFDARVFVDTGPILERELAAVAGLGWVGKSTMLLDEQFGSYLFLGEVFTTLKLEPDSPLADRCGNCTRCLDACPTRALVAPYQLDASRCISYLTIEHRGEVPEELCGRVSDWIYGCDVCQEVCPYNRRGPLATQPEIAANLIPARLPLLDLLTLRSGDYRRLTRSTAGARASRNMWRRNAAVALGNAERLSDEERLALRAACEDGNVAVRRAACWALRRHEPEP